MAWIDPPPLPCLVAAGTLYRDVLPWLLVLLAVVVVGGVVMVAVRRMLRPQDPAAHGFTLHVLRQMRARGELTDEEFERSRDSLIRGVRDAAPADKDGPDDAATTGNPPDASA